MQSIERFVLAAAALCMTAATSGFAHSTKRSPAAGPHIVTMHIESLRHLPARVHITSDTAGLWLRGDTTYRTAVTIDTPNDVTVGLQVSHIELRTDNNQPVRVEFTDGATDGEKRLRPWGWLMSFRRVNGDLHPEAKVLPAEPAVARRN